jgi:hypothetical protein
MDSKNILNKIMTMLGVDKEVELGGNANAGGPFFGKLENGSPVMTDYFDLGHVLFVIGEDGSKTAAPDADHIINLPVGLAGGQKRYFITTKDGIITSMNLEDNHGAKKTNVNFAAETTETKETKMENTELAVDEVKVDGPAPEMKKDEKDMVEKEEKMQEGDSARLDSLEEQVNQLRVDIAQVFELLKKKSEDMEKSDDDSEDMKKTEMSAQAAPKAEKKFTGAPVEEKVNLGGLVKGKNNGSTTASVLARMANSRF